MKQTDFDRFGAAFGTMCEVFEKATSPIITRVYFRALSAFSVAEVENAMAQAIGTLKFFPKPAELIELIAGKPEAESTQIETAATSQVAEVMKQIRTVGFYGHPVFDDPLTLRLLSGRWTFRSLCQMTETELKWWAKDFIEAYRSEYKTGTMLLSQPPRSLSGMVRKIGSEI